jgi:ABC-type nitrate/sulfonate/bicarbonate transport system substrate-binding protein
MNNHASSKGETKMKRRMLVSLLVLLVISSTVLFAGASAEKRLAAPLKVGLMPSAVGAPVQYALEKGYFKDAGVEIEIVIFPSGAPINEAMAAKQIDVACSGAATIFSLATGNTKLLADVASSGGMGIWTRPNSRIMTVKGQVPGNPEIYGNAATVKGTKFLASLGTASQYNVLRYIERLGLKESDIQIVHMDWGAAVQAFNAGEGDAIATFAPYSFQVMERGAVMVTTFEDATQTALYDMMFSRKDIIDTRRDDLVKFMVAFQRAVEDLGNDDIRREFSMRWFAENGRTYTQDTMTQEMIDRRYVTKAVMSSPNYVLGEAMPNYARFNVSIGKIENDNLKYVDNAFDSTILKEAVGLNVRAPNDK